MPQLYVRTDFTSVLYSFILVFLLTLSPLIQMFCSFASAAVERRFLLMMSSSSPITVPTFFAFLYSLPDLDSVVCSVLSALTSKLYFFNVFCTSAISANSNPIKSTSSAYIICWQGFFKIRSRSWQDGSHFFQGVFKVYGKKTGLRLSPCGDPMLLSNGFSFVAPFILVFMMVSLKRKCIILSSSSSIISLSMSSKVCLSIVSKADDMSIAVILISTSSFLVLAASHFYAHATSAMLLSGLNPLWL